MAIITADLIATTTQQYAATIEKNLPRLSPVLTQVAKKGNSTKGGWSGTLFRQSLEYNLNTNVMFYANSEVWRMDRQNIMSYADFYVRQLAGTITIEGIEEVVNSGPEAQHNFVKTKVKNLERSMQQIVAESFYFDGTEYSGKAFTGAPGFYSLTPATGVVGGIDRATAVDNRGRAWWRNQITSIGAVPGNAPPAAAVGEPTIRPTVRAMLYLNVKVKNGADMPDLQVMPDDLYLRYMEEVMEKQMITTTSKDRAGYGFNGVTFGFAPNLDVVNDSVAAAGTGYMLNTDYLFQRKQKGKWMSQREKVNAINQDVTAQTTIAYGNNTVSNMERNGLLTL
jgi:hypothetical protein